ncbi:hypothetical protein FGO68_gene9691 [Halteria grandinella]|uniref:Uncharacterized protein n=1 Tax=Halteria grandinella TaxID=5974 RepID=A0A8J8T4H6_HALGN|nr:hypothetical protein FGO68_gene9691 [Halteria grandinella]
MDIKLDGNQQFQRYSSQSITLNAFTVIQQYLTTNFNYLRLSLTSQKVRQALLCSALRKNRHLFITVQDQDMPNISPTSVRQMVEFAESITISVKLLNGNKWIENLDMLSKKLWWSLNFHKFDENFITTKFNICSSSHILCAMLTSEAENLFAYPNLVSSLDQSRMDNFLGLMNQIQGFRKIQINGL